MAKGWQSAKEKIDRFYSGDSETNLDPRTALSVDEDRREWHASEGGILYEAPLQEVTLGSELEYGEATATAGPQGSEFDATESNAVTPGYAETIDQPAEDAGPWEELYSDWEDTADAEEADQSVKEAGPWEELYGDSEESDQSAEDAGPWEELEVTEVDGPWEELYDDSENINDVEEYVEESDQLTDSEFVYEEDGENNGYQASLDSVLADENNVSDYSGEENYSTAFQNSGRGGSRTSRFRTAS